MPEGPEIEMSEIKEKIEEMTEIEHEERAESSWTRQVALTTAFVAVFAAIGGMESGAKVNEAMVNTIKASDKWNEFQANKLKAHAYNLRFDEISDTPNSPSAARAKAYKEKADGYVEKADKELAPEAKKLEEESEHLLHEHHGYAKAVTMLQVSIALSAVSVLTKQKLVWGLSLLLGGAGAIWILKLFLG